MKDKDASTLVKFQDIVEPFELTASTPIVAIVIILVVVTLYLWFRHRNRGLLYFIAKIEQDCRTGLCSPREAVQRTYKALDAAGVEFNALKEKFVAYQFSKVAPAVDEVSALFENLRSLIVNRRC